MCVFNHLKTFLVCFFVTFSSLPFPVGNIKITSCYAQQLPVVLHLYDLGHCEVVESSHQKNRPLFHCDILHSAQSVANRFQPSNNLSIR